MEKIIKNPKIIKLICIIFATLLWIYVSYQENPTMTKTIHNVPILVSGEQALKENGFSVYSVSSQSVNIRATANRLSLRRLNNKTISATVNVSSIKKAGTYTIPAIATSTSISDADLYVKSRDITVIIEAIDTKKFDVEAIISKTADSSVKVMSTTLSSEKVFVTAPESILKEISYIGTEEIIPEINPVSQSVKLVAYAKNGKILEGVECNPSEVTVNYSLYNAKTVPVVLKTSDGNQHTLPARYTADIYGYGNAFDTLKYIETQAIDISHFEVGTKISVQLNVPEGIYLHSVSEVEIELKQEYY